jgi:hypothetical protein
MLGNSVRVPLLVLVVGSGPCASFASAQRTDTVVKVAGAPVHLGVAKLVREISIGVVDGADEYVLGSVSEIAVAADGSIYVFDRHVPALRKYDANGKFVKTFGRRGQGPGEYLSVSGVAVAGDGRVFLWDTGNWRMNVYAPNGELVTSWSTASGSTGSASMNGARALMVDTAGRIYARRSIFERPPRFPARQVWIRYRADGSTIDTLEMPTFAVALPALSATSPGGNGMSSTGVPFAAMPRWTMSPLGYLVTGVSDRYAFEVHGKPSEPVVSVRRPNVPAIPVSNQERDSARAAVETSMRRVDAAWTWNGPPIPRSHLGSHHRRSRAENRCRQHARRRRPAWRCAPAAAGTNEERAPKTKARPLRRVRAERCLPQPSGNPAALFERRTPRRLRVGHRVR